MSLTDYRKATRREARLRSAADKAAVGRAVALAKLHRTEGMSYGQIAHATGLSRSRVQQLVERISMTTTLSQLLDRLIARGHGDNLLSDGGDTWDVYNLADAVRGEDDEDDTSDWVADIDKDGVAALVRIDPDTQLRIDHPPAYQRPTASI